MPDTNVPQDSQDPVSTPIEVITPDDTPDHPDPAAATVVPEPTVEPNPVDAVDTAGNDDPQNSVPVIPVDQVPGSPESPAPTGDQTAVPQPQAPNPVPATAAPSQDAVTINTHLHKVADDLTAVANYIRDFLADHEASKVIGDLESIAETIRNLVQ